MTPEASSVKPEDNDRELYLQKIRDRLNRDSPLVAKSKEKQKEQYQGAYRKIISLANGPRPGVTKNKLRDGEANANDTKLPVRGNNAPTGIPSPSDKPRSASGGLSRSPAVHHAPNQKRGQQQQQNEEPYNDSSSQKSSTKTNNTADSSIHSRLSLSPISGPSSSATEWEDKFVVNMPSAKDPNPPMMTAQQISEFQQSIERVQREGGSMDDPDASPSPRTTTPEDKLASTESLEKPPTRRGRSNTTTNPSTPATKEGDDQGTKARLKSDRYYSPQEVGKQRCSTIWEESPSKQKKKGVNPGSDGCFLGCKEIKGPEERNPDEILYFSTTTERPKVVDILAPISRKPRAAGKPTGRRMVPGLEEKLQIQREWRSISDNLKLGQSSMPLPKNLCKEPACHQPGGLQIPSPRRSGKENVQVPRSSSTPVNNISMEKDSDSPDDIVMNIPNISHAPVTSETKAPKPIGSQLSKVNSSGIPASRMTAQTKPSSGLRPPTQNSREKGDYKSKASSLSSTTPKSPPISIHINKSRGQQDERPPENQRGVRGFMRIPGMVKSSTENFAESVRQNLPRPSLPNSIPKGGADGDADMPTRSVSGPAQVALDQNPSSSGGVSPISSIIKGEGRNAHDTAPSARIIEVAELDGYQLHGEARWGKKATPSIVTTSSTATATTTATDTTDGINEDKNRATTGPYPLTLTLLFDILVLSVTHFQRLTGDCLSSQYPQMVLRAVVNMVEHCIHVARRISLAFSVYRATGAWPKVGERDLGRSLTDVGQAVVYLVVLGFVMIIVGRAAGYVVLVGSWVVWVAKPFGWAFGLMARALVP